MDVVYLLECIDDGDTYIGCTNDIERRLSQHNGKQSGGAKYTHGKRWRPFCYVGGFKDRRSALQFEWRSKRVCVCGKNCKRGCVKLRRRPGESRVHRRVRCIYATIDMQRWTKHAAPTSVHRNLYVGTFSKENARQLEEIRKSVY